LGRAADLVAVQMESKHLIAVTSEQEFWKLAARAGLPRFRIFRRPLSVAQVEAEMGLLTGWHELRHVGERVGHPVLFADFAAVTCWCGTISPMRELRCRGRRGAFGSD
jgi:hypothetical protein